MMGKFGENLYMLSGIQYHLHVQYITPSGTLVNQPRQAYCTPSVKNTVWDNTNLSLFAAAWGASHADGAWPAQIALPRQLWDYSYSTSCYNGQITYII